MFLHSGASLHGHEYSSRPPPGASQALNRRSPLLRSPFSAPLARSVAAPPSQQPRRQPSPRQPARPTEPTQHLQSCLHQAPASRVRRSTLDEPVVRFQEPLEQVEVVDGKHELGAVVPATVVHASEEEVSCSEASDAPNSGAVGSPDRRPRRRRRLPRESSTFFFARPPPRVAKKRLMKPLVRPKLLLQLHQLAVEKRPTPVLDVFLASTIAGPPLGGRFAKRFPRIFGVMGDRSELGSQDVILLRSEEYCKADGAPGAYEAAGDDEEDNFNRRELVAVLSPLRREDRTEIVLDDGSVWVAEQLPNGSFEFTHTDAQGTTSTARWVRRSMTKAANPTSPAAVGSPLLDPSSPVSLLNPWAKELDEYRYTFSVIDPLSRRHPIMATLTQSTLDVLENYTTVSSSYGKYPPSRPFARSHGHGVSSDEEEDNEEGGAPLHNPERQTRPVDVATRNLISITAVWVTLRLSGNMSPIENVRPGAVRSNSNGVIGAVASANPTLAKRDDQSGAGQHAPAVCDGNAIASAPPRRATSSGAAFIQRRMQALDASDSERASASRLRSKGRRVLSGDWHVSWKRHSNLAQVAAVATDTAPSTPQPQQQEPCKVGAVVSWPPSTSAADHRPGSAQRGLDHATTRPQLERRVQSAIYMTPPATPAISGVVEECNDRVAAAASPLDGRARVLTALESGGLEGSVAAAAAETDAEKPEKGKKRLSGWFRRFGR